MDPCPKLPPGQFSLIRRRELGSFHPRAFARSVGASESFSTSTFFPTRKARNSLNIAMASVVMKGLVKTVDLYGELKGHDGHVNTVQFNSTGNLLISSSDDKEVITWNWAENKMKLAYTSGHQGSVLQAQFMPFTGDSTIITSASDGQVRIGKIADGCKVSSELLGTHQGRVLRLAIEPGSPHRFYSCATDGFVQHFDLRTPTPVLLFSCTSFSGIKRPIRLHTMTIDPQNPNLFCVGGLDQYARIYDARNYRWNASSYIDRPVDTFSPPHLLDTDDMVRITGLAYSKSNELLVSYNDELIYLFEKNMGIGPDPLSASMELLLNRDQPQVYRGHKNARSVKWVCFFGPGDEYVVSGSDCAHIFIWKKKGGELIRMMPGDKRTVNCVVSHPHSPFLATSGHDKSVKLWAPTGNVEAPLPEDAEMILEANQNPMVIRMVLALPAPGAQFAEHLLKMQRREVVPDAQELQAEVSHSEEEIEEENEGEDVTGEASDSESSSEALWLY